MPVWSARWIRSTGGCTRAPAVFSPPTAELTLFSLAGVTRLAWLVHLEPGSHVAAYAVIVDASDGKLLWRHNLTRYLQTIGDVFLERDGEYMPPAAVAGLRELATSVALRTRGARRGAHRIEHAGGAGHACHPGHWRA